MKGNLGNSRTGQCWSNLQVCVKNRRMCDLYFRRFWRDAVLYRHTADNNEALKVPSDYWPCFLSLQWQQLWWQDLFSFIYFLYFFHFHFKVLEIAVDRYNIFFNMVNTMSAESVFVLYKTQKKEKRLTENSLNENQNQTLPNMSSNSTLWCKFFRFMCVHVFLWLIS